jgi:hypothetical protein
MGGGSSTARLASSTSQRTPISQATTQHGRWQFHRPSRILHVTASPRSCERRPRTGGGSSTTRLASSMSRRAPDLPSNCPSWVVAVPPPVSRPPRHGEPPILRAAPVYASLMYQYWHCPNILHTCIWGIPHQPKKKKNRGAAGMPWLVMISNRVLWVSR